MKTMFALFVAAVSLLAVGVSSAQGNNMMNGGAGSFGWMGGYGGIGWLVLIVVVGLVVWFAKRSDK